MVCLPTYNERDNLEPMVRALGEQIDTGRDRVLVIDDNSPDGTGAIADGLAAELPWVEVLHRAGEGGAREGVPRRIPPRARGGRRARARDRLRLLARPEGGAPPHRHLRGGRRSRPRLPLGRGRRHRQLGPRPHVRLARRELLRPHDPRRRRARPDGRLQVLPPRRRSRRSISTRSRPRATGSRSRRPTARFGRASGSSRSRSRSSTGASASRRWTARSCVEAMLQVPVLRYRALRGRAVERRACTYTSPHGRGHRRDVRRRGARQRDPGDRRVRGALVPALQGDRAGPDRDRRRRATDAFASSSSTSTRASARPSRYGVLSVPTVILFAGGEARETLIGPHGKSKLRAHLRAVSGGLTR